MARDDMTSRRDRKEHSSSAHYIGRNPDFEPR
jgi:hypothetical protein